MKTIDDLGLRLRDLFDQISTGEMDLKQAVELNNTAGKIINTYKVQLAYHALRGETPNIPFLAAAVEKVVQPKLSAP